MGKIGTINDCDIFEQDDGSVTFSAGATLDGVAPIVLGCCAVVTNSRNGKSTEAVVADTGPRNHLGEISVACAKAIGIPTGTTHPANGGGASSPTIEYRLFPGIPAVVNGG